MNDNKNYSSESENVNSTNIFNEELQSYGTKSDNNYYSENKNGDLSNEDLDKYKKGKPIRSIIKARLI